MFITYFNALIIAALSIWLLVTAAYTYMNLTKVNASSPMQLFLVYVLLITEFLVAIGYPVIFYILHHELDYHLQA